MQTVTVHTAQNIDIDYEVAGLGERILARLIDIGLFIALALAFVLIAAAASWNKAATITLAIIYGVIYSFYDLVSEMLFNGHNIGKYLMKIKVISLSGARPSSSQYLLRWLFRIIDFGITQSVCALICVAVSEKKQRVGDIVAGTTLIKTVARTKMENLAFMQVTPEGYTPTFTSVTQLKDSDITLIYEVITNYNKTHNSVLVYNMATRIEEHLGITVPQHMENLKFLQIVISDYNYLTSMADV